MIPESLPWFVFVAIVLIALLSWWWQGRNRINAATGGRGITPIGSLREGQSARVQGMLRYIAGPPLMTPIGKRRCVAYSVRTRAPDSDGDWRTILEDQQGLDFLIRDDTGTARVELTRYELPIVMDYDLDTGAFSEPPQHVVEYLESHDESHKGMLGLTRRFSFLEGALQHGEIVSVTGRVRFEDADEPGASAGYRDKPRRAVIVAPAESPMIISDDPRVTGRSRSVSPR